LHHGAGVAGGVDDDVAEPTFGNGFDFGEVRAIGLGENGVRDAEVFRAEVETVLGKVNDEDFEVHQFEELQTSQANGAGPDDHDGFTGLRVAAFDGVVADGESFHESEFVVGKVIAGMKLVSGNGPVGFAKSAALVNSNYGNVRAGIGVTFFGGNRIRVVEVRFERAFVSGLHVGDSFADRDDFQAEFMSGSTGVGKEGELAEVAGKVGAADSHAVSSDESFSRSGCFDIGKINGVDFFDVSEFDSVRHRMS